MSANLSRHFRTLWPLIAFGWLTTAPTLATEPTVDAQALGITDSILAYCGRFDPAIADKIRARIKQLENGASEQQLAAIRNSEEYRKAHESMDEFVAKVDEHNAKSVCSAPAAQGK
jgi:hypothetical protein